MPESKRWLIVKYDAAGPPVRVSSSIPLLKYGYQFGRRSAWARCAGQAMATMAWGNWLSCGNRQTGLCAFDFKESISDRAPHLSLFEAKKQILVEFRPVLNIISTNTVIKRTITFRNFAREAPSTKAICASFGLFRIETIPDNI